MRTSKQLKLRRNLTKYRTRKVLCKPKKTYFKAQTLNKSTYICEEQKDNILCAKAPHEMKLPAKKLFCNLFRDFHTFSRSVGFPTNMRGINQKNPTADKVMLSLLLESIYTNTDLMHPPGRSKHLPLLSKLPSSQTRKVRTCGNYTREADSFIQKANEYFCCAHRKQQKKINLKKSQFFPAFKEAKKILNA